MSDEVATIVDQLAEQAAPIVGAEVRAWTDRFADYLSGKVGALPSSTQGLAAAALATLQANAPALESVSEQGFMAVLHHLAFGDEDAARQVWLQGSAEHRARMDALDAAYAKSEEERERSASVWAAVKAAAWEFLKAGGAVAFPLLLGFVGL